MDHDNSILPEYPFPDLNMHFLASENELYDYQNLYSFAIWFKKTLESYDIGDGSPVMLFADSSDELVFCVAACWLLQIPFIPLSPNMSDQELQSVLDSITPSVAITDNRTKDRLENIPCIVIQKSNLTMQKIIDISIFSNDAPEKLIGYFLTSGSTGTPKIVPLKRRQMLFGASASGKNFKPDINRYWLLCLPLNHVGGISIILRCLLYRAATYRMEKFDTEQVHIFLTENKLFEVASLVPTMLNRLLRSPDFRVHRDFKAILLGGGPITTTLLQKSIERGLPIVVSYGMTETCAQIAANPLLKPSGVYHPRKSVGKIFKPNLVEIRNNHGQIMPLIEPGLIWLKGPQVFDGYLNKSHNEGKFDQNGWFNTGDIGYLNRTDQLFILIRRSDLIISGGENINPVEVESALEKFDAVKEAAVIGVSDSDWGQIVIAFIALSPGADPNEEMIKTELKKNLSAFKIPKKLIFLEQLPYTESGKLHKQKLLEMYESEGYET